MEKLILGKKYRVVKTNEYQAVGEIGTCIRDVRDLVLMFPRQNMRFASAWSDGWHMYSGTDTVVPADMMTENTLGNFPKKGEN